MQHVDNESRKAYQREWQRKYRNNIKKTLTESLAMRILFTIRQYDKEGEQLDAVVELLEKYCNVKQNVVD